ncbi:hypothetical protein NA29_01155 [Pandoraea sputorum]|nr:hypothetical protein NA29_01155 [Pandoraea sputorum]
MGVSISGTGFSPVTGDKEDEAVDAVGEDDDVPSCVDGRVAVGAADAASGVALGDEDTGGVSSAGGSQRYARPSNTSRQWPQRTRPSRSLS